MHFYDEEVSVNGPSANNFNAIKVEKIPAGRINSADADEIGESRQKNKEAFIEEEGLLHGSDQDDVEATCSENTVGVLAHKQQKTGATSQRLPTFKMASSSFNEISDSESEDADGAVKQSGVTVAAFKDKHSTSDSGINIAPEQWEDLSVSQEAKDLFMYLLKYTPQNIETTYILQTFIPEYVPAVGDVDGFLKINVPPLIRMKYQNEVSKHMDNMGVYFLDEPSGEQSEPTVLSMKLRSMLRRNGINPRSSSVSLIPVAKSIKDIDKWITEVEHIHVTQNMLNYEPIIDIEPLLIDWPRTYGDSVEGLQNIYYKYIKKDNSLLEYVDMICQSFDLETSSKATQINYILKLHAAFTLWLVASEIWD